MDNDEARPPIAAQLTNDDSRWQTLSQLNDKQLHYLFGGAADELVRRAKASSDPNRARHLLCASSKLVEARCYMRPLAFSAHLSAAPGPDVQRGADQPGAPTGDTTTPGAAESLPTCSRCLHSAKSHGVGIDTMGGCVARVSRGGLCDCTGYVPRDEAPPSRQALTAEGRGQRGPKAAEGADEVGRAEQGPVDLAAHLAAVKNGGAA